MAKNGVFKKITALAMAIALVVCFAVSASAEVNVATTTKYVTVNNVQEIEVNVTVTATNNEFKNGDNVTYYATDDDGAVHIDQAEVSDGKAEFNFNVADGKLGSDVVIGYTGASAAEDSTIKGYTVTLDGVSKVTTTEDKTVQFDYEEKAGKQYKEVTTSTPGAVIQSCKLEGSTITVIFSSISSDVALTLVEETVVVESSAKAEHIDSGAVLTTGKNDQYFEEGEGEEDTKGNVLGGTLKDDTSVEAGARKITVMGKVSGLGTDAVYGVIITTGDIAEGSVSMSAEEFNTKYGECKYDGKYKASKGLFAVQVIDNSTENGFIVAGLSYNTAVYAQDADGNYTVTKGKAVTVPSADVN